jgi:hypothetical protein
MGWFPNFHDTPIILDAIRRSFIKTAANFTLDKYLGLGVAAE